MRKFTKKITAALVAGIMAIMMCVPAFAAEAETQQLPCDTPVHVNVTLYKTGTDQLSMGNRAFVRGATLIYDCDENVTSVLFDVEPVTAEHPVTGDIMTGHLTGLSIDGTAFSSQVTSNNITRFTGDISGMINLGQRYPVTVGIDIPGAHGGPMSGQIVFN